MPGFEAMRSDRGMTANLVEVELVPVEFHSVQFSSICNLGKELLQMMVTGA